MATILPADSLIIIPRAPRAQFFAHMVPLQLEAIRREAYAEDFLKGIQGWVEYYSVDECAE
jgi:hypothetical protein